MRLYPHLRWTRIVAVVSAALIGLSFRVSADTLVLPNHFVTNDYSLGSGILKAAGYRSQSAYGAVHFPTNIGLVITELHYRPDPVYGGAFTTTVANIQFNLSTTTRNAETLSSTFADNVGNDDTVVFNGQLPISSQFTGPPGAPKNFDIVITLTTPFLYNPAAGNLLVEVRNTSGSTVNIHIAGGSTNDAASRNGGVLGASAGGPDRAVEALQIVYTATNQPPPPPPPVAPPAQLTRGPYLQSGTLSNLIVRWRTSQLTNTIVRFGLTEAVPWSITNEVLTTNHIMTLTNLAPDTKYFYAVGAAETNFASGSNVFFITAPAKQRPTRIWVTGDAGTANQPDSIFYIRDPFGMRDAYYAYTSNRYTDVFLILGDNAYGKTGFPLDDGSDDSYETNLFGTFRSILQQTVVWPTLGNHDAVNKDAYLDMFSLPRNGEAGGVPSGSEYYHSFDYGNIHFVCLDSEFSGSAADGPMATWLKEDLENNTNQWLIAYWHHPPYTWGSHDSDSTIDSGGRLVQMRQNFLPILESHGVDLVLCGHSHVYERSFLLDGHYGFSDTLTPTMVKDSGSGREGDTGAYLKPTSGLSANEGAIYVVCGSSGWVYGNAVFNRYLKHPAMFVGLDKVGSMVIDVDTNRLDAKFLRSNGTIGDYFTLLKGAAPEPLRIRTSKIAGETISLQFKTIAGQRYQVLRATQLGPANWTPIGAVITAAGATTKWDAEAPNDENHFYQIVTAP